MQIGRHVHIACCNVLLQRVEIDKGVDKAQVVQHIVLTCQVGQAVAVRLAILTNEIRVSLDSSKTGFLTFSLCGSNV